MRGCLEEGQVAEAAWVGGGGVSGRITSHEKGGFFFSYRTKSFPIHLLKWSNLLYKLTRDGTGRSWYFAKGKRKLFWEFLSPNIVILPASAAPRGALVTSRPKPEGRSV